MAGFALALDVDNGPQQSRAHAGLAHAHRDLGDLAAARDHAARAADLCVDRSGPEADEVRALLAELSRAP